MKILRNEMGTWIEAQPEEWLGALSPYGPMTAEEAKEAGVPFDTTKPIYLPVWD